MEEFHIRVPRIYRTNLIKNAEFKVFRGANTSIIIYSFV